MSCPGAVVAVAGTDVHRTDHDRLGLDCHYRRAVRRPLVPNQTPWGIPVNGIGAGWSGTAGAGSVVAALQRLAIVGEHLFIIVGTDSPRGIGVFARAAYERPQ